MKLYHFKTDMVKTLISAAAFLILNLTILLGIIFGTKTWGSDSFNMEFSTLLYGVVQVGEDVSLEQSMNSSLSSIILMFVFGTYIYRQVDIRGTYYFVRQKNRKRWYREETMKLVLLIIVWTLLDVVLAAVGAFMTVKPQLDIYIVACIAQTFIQLLLFNIWSTHLVNVLSIRTGSAVALAITYIVIVASFRVSLIGQHDFPKNYFLPTEGFSLSGNVLEGGALSEAYESLKNSAISMAVTFGYFAFNYMVGYRWVSNMDIGLNNKEN